MRILLVALALFLARPGQTCGFYPPHVYFVGKNPMNRTFQQFGDIAVVDYGPVTFQKKLSKDVATFQLVHDVALFHNGVSLGLFPGKPVGEITAMGIRYALIADGDKIATVMLI